MGLILRGESFIGEGRFRAAGWSGWEDRRAVRKFQEHLRFCIAMAFRMPTTSKHQQLWRMKNDIVSRRHSHQVRSDRRLRHTAAGQSEHEHNDDHQVKKRILNIVAYRYSSISVDL